MAYMNKKKEKNLRHFGENIEVYMNGRVVYLLTCHIIRMPLLWIKFTKLNQSADCVYPFPFTTSGAMYYGVPQTLKVI